MSPLASILAAAALGAALTAGGLHLRDRQRAAEWRELNEANERLRADAHLPRSAAFAVSGVSSRPTSDTAPAFAPASALPADAPEPLPGAYRNAGNATPAATIQTVAWACDEANAEALAPLLAFDLAARERASSIFEALPPDVRAQWASPEDMATSIYISSVMLLPFPSPAILALAEPQSHENGKVRLSLPGTSKDGYIFESSPEGWKLVITDVMLAQAHAINQGKPPNAP